MNPANRAPIYAACCYPDLAEIARGCGYALAVHGSLARDFDLIAIPWADVVESHDALLARITETFAVKQIGEPEQKGMMFVGPHFTLRTRFWKPGPSEVTLRVGR